MRDRLLELANARGEQFNFVLVRYALERLLYRLSVMTLRLVLPRELISPSTTRQPDLGSGAARRGVKVPPGALRNRWTASRERVRADR